MGPAVSGQALDSVNQPWRQVGVEDGAEQGLGRLGSIQLPHLHELVDVDAGKSGAVRKEWRDVGDDWVPEQDVLPLAFDLGCEGTDGWRA